MARKLIYYPDPILRQKAHEVREFGRDLHQLANDMRHIMKAHSGMGLAAVQVGDPRQVLIVELPGDKPGQPPEIPFTVLVNPKITKTNNVTDTMKEGCLSIPAVEVDTERPTEVTVLAQTLEGEPTRIRAKGLFARILQHEIDHLNGRLILDYLPQTKQKTGVRTMVWGSTAFTTGVLNELITNPKLHITHLVTESPKPSGRGREVTHTVVHDYAQTLRIPCLEPTSLQDERFLSYLQAQQPELIIVAAYGKLLPPQILTIPTYGCLNVHPSLLPKYRGATPIQSAILNGDPKTGVTLIKMAPQFDTGAMIAQSEFELDGTETYGELETAMAELGGQMLNQIIGDYLAGKLGEAAQDETLASHTKKITKQDRWLNLDDPAEVNERKIRAFAPAPGAFVLLDQQPLKVLAAHIEDGRLVFDLVHPAGKRPMAWTDFTRGYQKPLHFEPYTSIMSKV